MRSFDPNPTNVVSGSFSRYEVGPCTFEFSKSKFVFFKQQKVSPHVETLLMVASSLLWAIAGLCAGKCARIVTKVEPEIWSPG